MKKMFLGFFCVIFAGAIIGLGIHLYNIHELSETPTTHNLSEGFQLSEAEKKEIAEFSDKVKTSGEGLNMVVNAANDGNPVAMYFSGHCSLLGYGTAVNRDIANIDFIRAASLGYAPALFEVAMMYGAEKYDPLLALVYLNLTISSGHKEYRDFYYQETKKLFKMAGKKVVQEIERIALKKVVEISEMQNDLEKRKNTYKPALPFAFQNIVSNDFIYNEEYWKPFFDSQELWKKFFGIANDKPEFLEKATK